MPKASSFMFKAIYLIVILVLVSIFLNQITNLNLAAVKTTKEQELRRIGTGILQTLTTSDKCLAYEEKGAASQISGQKFVDLKKLEDFSFKYNEIEPECARNYNYGFDVTVEKFPSNVTTLVGTENFQVCFIGGDCADPEIYLRNFPYASKRIKWSDIAQYDPIKPCSAILISCPIAYRRDVEGGVCSPAYYCCGSSCKCTRQDCDAIKDSLTKWIGDDGKLLITEGDAIEVVNYLFPKEYVWPCVDCPAAQSQAYLAGECYAGQSPRPCTPRTCKWLEWTPEGQQEISGIKNPFVSSFFGHSRVMKADTSKLTVLAQFSATLSSPEAGSYVPPAGCSDAAITHIKYGSGDIIHQVPLLEYQLYTDYGKVDVLGAYLKTYAHGESSEKTFKEDYQKWSFGSPYSSRQEALRTTVEISSPITIRINETTVQPGKITIRITDGELEELVGSINKACDTGVEVNKNYQTHYTLTQRESDSVCQEVVNVNICRKASCSISLPTISPGNYLMSIKKIEDKVIVSV